MLDDQEQETVCSGKAAVLTGMNLWRERPDRYRGLFQSLIGRIDFNFVIFIQLCFCTSTFCFLSVF